MSTSAPPVREREQRHDLVGGALGETLGARVGHRAGHVEQRLLGEVVRRPDDGLARMLEPEPAAHERRVLARRERRRDEDRRRPLVPQPVAQLGRDVDRSPDERVRLGPDDPIELAGLETPLDLGRGGERPPGERVEILALPLQCVREVAERVDQHERRLGGHLAQPLPARRRGDGAQQPLACALDAVDLPGGQGALCFAAGALDVGGEPAEPARETRPPSHEAADSSSRCASSKITASCSGSTPPPEARCAK